MYILKATLLPFPEETSVYLGPDLQMGHKSDVSKCSLNALPDPGPLKASWAIAGSLCDCRVSKEEQ